MPCTLNTQIAAAAGLSSLSKSEKEAAYLHYLAQAVLGSGNGDFTDINVLREAIQCWCVGGQTLDSFKLNSAITAGATATDVDFPTVAEIREAIKCWNCGIGGGERQAMEAFLLCKLLTSGIIA